MNSTPITHPALEANLEMIAATTPDTFFITNAAGNIIARVRKIVRNASTASWFTFDAAGNILGTTFASYSPATAATIALAAQARAAR